MIQRAVFLLALLPASAHAFCGFYVGGGGAALFNDATQVVLMREGTKTVLSMQNNYRGPPENFAMVIPVPVVLQKENVKTLTKNLFDKIDQLAAPRLVEYWEQDPCYQPRPGFESFAGGGANTRALAPMKKADEGGRDYGRRATRFGTPGKASRSRPSSPWASTRSLCSARKTRWASRTGAISCANPQRGKWGGPPNGVRPKPVAAEDLGLVKRDATLASKLVESPVPEFGLKGSKARAGIPVVKQ